MLLRRRDVADADQLIGEEILSGLTIGTGIRTITTGGPAERLAWAREHREYLWPDLRLDFDEHRYLVELYADEHPHVVVDKASQMGASEWAITDAFWVGDAKSANVLYLLPGTADVQDFSTARVGLAIEASPYIAGIITPDFGGDEYRAAARDRATLKRIRNRFFYLRHGSVRPDGRAPHLKTAQIDLVIYDEFDDIDPRAPALADKRQEHSLLKWVRWISTPTLPDLGIDREFKASDMRRWNVRCPRCRTEQPLDPFVNLILEVDGAGRPSRWFHKRGQPEAPFVGCRKCGRPLDRLAAGRWVAEQPGREAHGYHLNRLMNPRANLWDVIRKGRTYDETERQQWFNQDLGIPYQPTGGGFDETLIRTSYRGYRMPIADDRCMMGVDVGAVLHVVVRKFAREADGSRVRQAVFLGQIDRWEELDDLVERYDVRMAVVDALPEHHKALEWARRHEGRVKVAYYVGGKEGTKHDEPTREKAAEEFAVDLDRTRHFDALRASYLAREVVNPAGLEGLVTDYVQHFLRVKRVMATDGHGNNYATWTRTGDDHWVHAEIYCQAAMELIGPVADGETSAMVAAEDGRGRAGLAGAIGAGERGGWEREDGDDGKRRSAWR
jgi:hypothetical protein